MIRTVAIRCKLPKEAADAFNIESGRIYTHVLVQHYRIYRKKGVWLSPGSMEKLSDSLNRDRKPLLHAHSIDAAQQGFPKACKTARGSRKAGLDAAYPHKRKRFRTTIWKNTAIRRRGNRLELSTGKGNPKVISYHPHSGWFEEALPGRAINGEGSREAMRTHHHFGLNVQVQLLLTTIFFFLIRMQPLTFLSFSILLLTLAGSEENLLTFNTLERQSLFASHRQSRWLTPI
jgi:hypothetical protein